MFEDDQQRTVAIGIWITSFSAGAAIGPLVGGVLLESFHWGSVFLLAVPVMALLLAIGPRLLPEYKDPEPGRLDLASAALSLVAVLAVIYGIKAIAKDGLGLASAAPVLAGLAIGAAFVERQRRLADPMIDLGLFRRPAFSLALGANTLAFAVVFGIEVFVAQYFQLVLGYSPLEAGLWSVPGAARVRRRLAAHAAARGRASAPRRDARRDRRRDRRRRAAHPGGSDRWPGLVVAGVVILSLGLAPLFTLAADLAVGSAPPERAGAASGISETSSELGGALGLAILGTVGTAVYRGHAADAIPADVPADAAATASDTLGGAVEVADRLPQPLAAELLEPAREAFTQGLQVAATLSGVVVFAPALMVARARVAGVVELDARPTGPASTSGRRGRRAPLPSRVGRRVHAPRLTTWRPQEDSAGAGPARPPHAALQLPLPRGGSHERRVRWFHPPLLASLRARQLRGPGDPERARHARAAKAPVRWAGLDRAHDPEAPPRSPTGAALARRTPTG